MYKFNVRVYGLLINADDEILISDEQEYGMRFSKFPGGVNAFLDPSQRVSGLSTGFAKFDEMTGGLHGGEDQVSFSIWFRVPDIRAAVSQVRALGGRADEPALFPSGWSAHCVDDQGLQFNLTEPAPGYD